MNDELKYQEILDRLKDHTAKIAEECIQGGRREGHYFRGELYGKVSVHLSGSRIGMVGFWNGQAGNDKGGGGLIDLIQLAFGCKSHGEAVRLAKERYLGITRRELTTEEKMAWAKAQEHSAASAKAREAEEEKQQKRKVETVKSVWHAAVPIAGTLAEKYLVGRDIEPSDFGGAYPVTIRFHPRVRVWTTRDEYHPALIGAVQSVDRKLIALWSVYLTEDGKAVVGPDGKKLKIGFGPASGGAVRFGPVQEVLKIAEGMETGLGVHVVTRGRGSVWSVLSTSGMIGFKIPQGVKRLEIYADGDRSRIDKRSDKLLTPPGIKAANSLKERAQKEGVEAVIFPSPEPDDWLDVAQSLKRSMREQRFVEYLD